VKGVSFSFDASRWILTRRRGKKGYEEHVQDPVDSSKDLQLHVGGEGLLRKGKDDSDEDVLDPGEGERGGEEIDHERFSLSVLESGDSSCGWVKRDSSAREEEGGVEKRRGKDVSLSLDQEHWMEISSRNMSLTVHESNLSGRSERK